ncbi:MAG: LacI family DNA-binding transcriptional regulator [Opitutaceae bacterium]
MSGRPPITHREIARRLGCDKSTVSLALRGSKRISKEMRERVCKLADDLGYRPDPMLSALSHYRTSRLSVRHATTLGYLVHLASKDQLVTSPVHRSYLEGARAQAAQLGYNLEVFSIAAGDYEPNRLAGVLHARGSR